MQHKQPPSKAPADSDDRRETPERPDARRDGIQGEGNYEAAREFNEAERKFVEAGKVPAAARAAAPKSQEEQEELLAAEKAGKQRAKKGARADKRYVP